MFKKIISWLESMINTDAGTPKYLIHYQLEDIFRGCIKPAFYFNTIILFILLIAGDYPILLSSMDATFTILTIVFFAFIFPAMRKGKIIAYYRYSYHENFLVNLITLLIIMGSVMRFPVTYGLHALSYIVAKDPRRMGRYGDGLLRIMINPTCNLIAIGIFLFYIYLIFYKDKFSTMEEYSVRVTDIYKSSKARISYEECVDKFAYEKAKKKSDDAMALKNEQQTNQPCIRVERVVEKTVQPKQYTAQPKQYSEEVKKEEPETVVRRQARVIGGNKK